MPRMSRRSALALAAAGALETARTRADAAEWRAGPYLLLDRSLVDPGSGAVRLVTPPSRLPDPIVTGQEDGCFQPYVTVIRDPRTRRFRMWYGTPRTPMNGSESSLATIDSEDGIHWQRPHRVLRDPAPIQFGASVLDEGPEFPDARRRYRYGWWKDGGLQIATSADGLEWTPLVPGVVLPHNHDINAIDWDPIRKRYLAFVSFVPGDGPARGLRMPHESVSDDLIRWRQPWQVVRPDPDATLEKGETQFYCMAGALARGELLIALVKVLRDDLNCEAGKTARELRDPGRPFAGLGYTCVAYSRDGETWERETQPFLDRNPLPGTWDRAMAWGDDQLLVGDFTYVYYGGYRWGHKAERFSGRQIGFAQMPRDRYVAYVAGAEPALLRTTARRLGTSVQFTVNATVDPTEGELRARVLNDEGKPIAGFDFPDCRPVRGDRVNHPLAWSGQNASLRAKTVRLEFNLRHARLYAFDVLG